MGWYQKYGAILAVLMLFFSGCVSLAIVGDATVEHRLMDAAFQRENLPLRTLRVAVVAEERVDEWYLRSMLSDASALLESQVGIRMDVSVFRGSWDESRSLFSVHRRLKEFRRTHPDFDVVIGVALHVDKRDKWCWRDEEKDDDICVNGMIMEGRNIALHVLNPVIIAHEVVHAFIGIRHSPRGLMTSQFGDRFLLESDRREVLRNKWRNFRRQPNLIERCLGFC